MISTLQKAQHQRLQRTCVSAGFILPSALQLLQPGRMKNGEKEQVKFSTALTVHTALPTAISVCARHYPQGSFNLQSHSKVETEAPEVKKLAKAPVPAPPLCTVFPGTYLPFPSSPLCPPLSSYTTHAAPSSKMLLPRSGCGLPPLLCLGAPVQSFQEECDTFYSVT